jgi:hypothetical protein
MKTQNLKALLKWALHNGNERQARVIAGHIIAGTELCSYDL